VILEVNKKILFLVKVSPFEEFSKGHILTKFDSFLGLKKIENYSRALKNLV